jgi:hypothetical protein
LSSESQCKPVDLLEALNAQPGKPPPLALQTTLFEIDKANGLFSDPDAKLLLRPEAHVAKALGVSLEARISGPTNRLEAGGLRRHSFDRGFFAQNRKASVHDLPGFNAPDQQLC